MLLFWLKINATLRSEVVAYINNIYIMTYIIISNHLTPHLSLRAAFMQSNGLTLSFITALCKNGMCQTVIWNELIYVARDM